MFPSAMAQYPYIGASRLCFISILCMYYPLTRGIKICEPRQLSVMQGMECDDGYMGVGLECSCPQLECRIAHARMFLPNLTAYSKYYTNQEECDYDLGLQLTRDIELKSSFVREKGYPLDMSDQECALRVEHEDYNVHRIYHPCSVSIGKYLRFNSLFMYHRFAATARSRNKLAIDTLVDIEYPYEWKWARGIPACSTKPPALALDTQTAYQGWNCAFQDFSAAVTGYTRDVKLHNTSRVVLQQLRILKRTRPNNAAQIPLYGKILEILATPSALVKQYMRKHLISVQRGRCAESARLHGSESDSTGLHGRDSIKPPPSVSMHVRHGDSCDYISNIELSPENVDSHASRKYKRPCFAIEVYMARLRELQRRYAVRTVYLSTDSQQMIDYVLQLTARNSNDNDDFEWIFMNISRDVFDFSNGWVDFYNSSVNELVTFSAVADLEIIKQGDIFLGALSSHFSKLGFYIMAGHKMRLPPFVSLDLPLGCDTVDSCGMADIMARRQSVLDIIQWAPECRRKWDGGWIENDRDPCVAVTVSAYAHVTLESGGDHAPKVYATPVDPSCYTATVVAAPAQNRMVTYARPITRQSSVLGISSRYRDALTLSANIIRAVGISRSLKCLAAADTAILLLFAIFWPLMLILLVGPLCGYFGASRFKIQFTYAYSVYWGFRLLMDLLFISQGLFWFIISLFVGVYIIRYLYIFTTTMKCLTPEELDMLSTATEAHFRLRDPEEQFGPSTSERGLSPTLI